MMNKDFYDVLLLILRDLKLRNYMIFDNFEMVEFNNLINEMLFLNEKGVLYDLFF